MNEAQAGVRGLAAVWPVDHFEAVIPVDDGVAVAHDDGALEGIAPDPRRVALATGGERKEGLDDLRIPPDPFVELSTAQEPTAARILSPPGRLGRVDGGWGRVLRKQKAQLVRALGFGESTYLLDLGLGVSG